jgi:hypothetical protein
MNRNHILFILSLVFSCMLLQSCTKAELSPSEYIAWCDRSENNLVRVYRQNNLELTCQYNSAEYVSVKQSDPGKLDAAEVKNNTAAVSDLVHFKLKFRDTTSNNFLRTNYTSAEEFNIKSMYLSFDVRYDFKLVQGDDTSECVLNHHERTYGSTPYETLLIAFPKLHDGETDLELIFNDRVFGFGRVKFFFEKEDLNAIPKLVL